MVENSFKDVLVASAGAAATLWAIVLVIITIAISRVSEISSRAYPHFSIAMIILNNYFLSAMLFSLVAIGPVQLHVVFLPYAWGGAVVTSLMIVNNWVQILTTAFDDGSFKLDLKSGWRVNWISYLWPAGALYSTYLIAESATTIGQNLLTAMFAIKSIGFGVIISLAYALFFTFGMRSAKVNREERRP